MAVEVKRPKKTFSSDFAANQLAKSGWEDGQGLGRDKQGIKEAIKVSAKNDKNGLGVDLSEQFVFHWWDHVFNKVASSIKVEHEDGEVKLSKNPESEKLEKISSKKPSNVTKGKDLLYGRFIRSGTCTESDAKIDTKSCDESSEDESKLDFSSKDTLEKAFKLTGGRTAHKAARHGHKLSGKLKRLEEQEKSSPVVTPNASPKRSDSTDYESSSCKKKRGSGGKRSFAIAFDYDGLESCGKTKKKKKDNKIRNDSKCMSVDRTSDLILAKDEEINRSQTKKLKKKKKRREEKCEEDALVPSSLDDCVLDGGVKKRKKSKKKDTEGSYSTVENDVTHKKRKKKKEKNVIDKDMTLSEVKQKKKRKTT
eukprot:gene14141-15618_t